MKKKIIKDRFNVEKPCHCGHRSTGYNENIFPKHILDEGMVVEFEHTCDENLARRIAADHLADHGPQYYVELKKMIAKLDKLDQELPDKRKERKSCRNYKDS